MYRLAHRGREVDASFGIAITSPKSFEITLESAGGTSGTSASRNYEYPQALELILERLARISATLEDCLISSRIAMNLAATERRVHPAAPYAYPIALNAVQDFSRLRLALTAPQGSIASSRVTGGGNQRKRITLYFSSITPNLGETAIADALQASRVTTRQGSRKDIAVGLSRDDIEKSMARWRELGPENFHREFGTSKTAKFVIVDDSGDIYDAKAILFAARVMKGWTDEQSKDFDGDRASLAIPLEHLGLMIEELAKVRTRHTLVPEVPSDSVRQELIDFLNEDETRLGQVYRGLDEGLSAEQIAKSLGLATPNFVWNYSAMVTALLDGSLPSGPTVALQVARKFRKIIATADLSAEAVSFLQANQALLESLADNTASLKQEEEQALRATEAAERTRSPGVYVYALPHYLRYPYDPATGRTLLKVGYTENSAIQRFLDQTRTTALPEEPVLLRIYASENAQEMEKKFHSVLTAFDHSKEVERTAGKEWFLTTLGHLDAVASALGLPIDIVTDLGSDD